MTDRIHALTVILEKDMRDDDVQSLVDAILHMKNVISVKKRIATPDFAIAQDRAKHELRMKLWEILK